DEYRRAMAGELPDGWESKLPSFKAADGKLATRQASAKTLDALMSALPNLVGGSADLSESTGTALEDVRVFGPATTGRLFHWGVREHAMTAAMNGIAAHGGQIGRASCRERVQRGGAGGSLSKRRNSRG